MASVTIEQSHSLPAAEAKTRVDALLTRLAAKYGGSFTWRSDTEAALTHSMAKATARLEPSRVVVQVDGGMALSLVKGKLEARVKQELATALA